MTRKKGIRRKLAVCSDSESDSDDEFVSPKVVKTPKPIMKKIPPILHQDEVMGVASEDEFDGDGDALMKMAEDVVDKNAKLTKLFDPAVMAGFTMLMKKSEKVGDSTKAMEACAKVYQQKVDSLYTNVNKVSTTMVKLNEKQVKKSEKKIAFADENLDYWLTDKDAVESESHESQTLFSGDEDEPSNFRTEMTMVEYRKDQTMMAPPDVNVSFNEFDDTSELGKKVKAFCKDRTLLTKGKLLSLEQLEIRFKRADDAAMKYMASERVKMFGGLKTKKTGEKERKDYTDLDYPFFNHAMIQKRENAHVSLEDVAETNEDCSLVYLHNHWKEIDDAPNKMADELEDWVVDDLENVETGNDIVSSVLEHLQGTLENSTAEEHILPEELVELFGLEKKDLRRIRNTEAFCNVSFEQTASKDIDEGKMIDQLENEEEEEYAAKELERLDFLTTELFKDRENLLENAQNPREMSIRQEMHRPKYTPYYDDEDRFFNYDYRKYLTTDSVRKEVCETAKIWIQYLTPEIASELGIHTNIYKILKNIVTSPSFEISDDVISVFALIPDYIFAKCLMHNYCRTTSLLKEAKMFDSALLPFRISRYAQYVVSSVLHESMVVDMEECRSRVASSLSFRSLSHVSPRKKARFDESLQPDGYAYFFALEPQSLPRYSGQKIVDDKYSSILDFIVDKMQDERYLRLRDKGTNDPTLLDAYWAILTIIGYFQDHKRDDLTDTVIVDVTTISDDAENEDSAVENMPLTQCHEDLVNNIICRFDNQEMLSQPESLPDMDFDYNADVQSDFVTARNTPIQEETLHDNLCDDVLLENPSSPIKRINVAEIVTEFNDELNDSLAMLLDGYTNDNVIEEPKKKRKFKLNAVKDTAHYDDNQMIKKAGKKKKRESENPEQFIDDMAFAPRDTFSNVSTRRGRSRTPSEVNEPERILRVMDVTLPEQLACPPKFRIDDPLTMTIPGYGDPDRMFVSCPLLNSSKNLVVTYKGMYSHLPPTSTLRQAYDLMYITKYHKLINDIEELRTGKRCSSVIENQHTENNIEPMEDDDFGSQCNDGPYFDALDINNHSLKTDATNINDFYKEYGNADSEFGFDDEEDDEFDFESILSKSKAKFTDNPFKYHLKRAIRFILSRAFIDRSSIEEDIQGIKPPGRDTPKKSSLKGVAESTPFAKKNRVDDFNDNLELDLADDVIINGLEDMRSEEEIPVDETDETKMPPFTVKGFHTFRSVLYYLPKYCVPETIELLSTAHVFSIICHMVNENSLHLSQDMYDDDDIEDRNDYVIENYEDYEKRISEFEFDEMGVTSAEDLYH